MKKRIFVWILLAALCFCLPVSAAEEDRILVDDSLYYDKKEDCYVYELEQDQELKSNVRTGILTNDPVTIEFPVGLNVVLYKDGNALTDPDYTSIADPGEYSLCYVTDDGIVCIVMKFTIIGKYYNGDANFVPPDGFIITGLTREGQPAAYWNNLASLQKEGSYVMKLTDVSAGKDTTLYLTVDRTPPVLALKEVNNGKAISAVDISDYNSQDNIYITRGGRQIEYTSLLTKSGNYEIILTDPAGNETTYKFEILVRYNFNYLTLVLVALAIAGVVLIIMLHSRRSQRIR